MAALVEDQLREQAGKLRLVVTRLHRGEFQSPALRAAADPEVWAGGPQRAFCGWLEALDGWVRNTLARDLDAVAAQIELRASEVADARLKITLGVPGAELPSWPPQPMRTVPPPPPEFHMQATHDGAPRMNPEQMRSRLVQALGQAHDGVMDLSRRLRDLLVEPALAAGAVGPVAVVRHLPPDAQEAAGAPASYLAWATQLDRALQDILERAQKWEAAQAADTASDHPDVSGLSALAAAASAGARQAATSVRPGAAIKGPVLLGARRGDGPSPLAAVIQAPTERDRRRYGASDAKRINHKLDPGFWHFPDPDGARRLLAEAAARAGDDPRYAVGFLRQLGPKGLRRLIDEGMDPCDIAGVVAAATVVTDPGSGEAVFGTDFLAKALGKDKREGPRRAAILGSCPCPPAPMHPAWTAKLATTLYDARGSRLEGDRDPRPWFHEVAAHLITQLDPPPPGLDKEAEDALEDLVAYAHLHPLDSPGNLALARLLTRPDTLPQVAQALSARGGLPEAAGFRVAPEALRPVLADLVSDPSAGPLLRQAAARFAQEELSAQAGVFVANPADDEASRLLASVGALFGALGSRSYDVDAAVDVAEVGRDAVQHLFEHLAGPAFDAAKTSLAISIPVEAGKTIVFALAGDGFKRDKKAREALESVKGQARRGRLQGSLQADLQYLTYLTLLTDPAARSRIGLNLDPSAFPHQIPTGRDHRAEPLLHGIHDVAEWKRLVFPDGNLHVPDPSRDPVAWGAFLAWAGHVNPALAKAAVDLDRHMAEAFHNQVGASQ